LIVLDIITYLDGGTFCLYMVAMVNSQLPNILVVDDDPVLRASLAALLSCNGYCVVDAASGRQAVAIIKAAPDQFVAAIVDQAMPEMTGIELYSILRAHNPRLPIVMLSGYAAEDVLRPIRGDNVDPFLVCLEKPTGVQLLSDTLRRLQEEATGETLPRKLDRV
jgi:CheY-like chemotaxis protein